MSWQTQTPADRFFGSIAYLLPIADAFFFGFFIFRQFPLVGQLYIPLYPLIWLDKLDLGALVSGGFLSGLVTGGFIIFLLLYRYVVINPRISRFIRFNVLQAIMLGILLSLTEIAFKYPFLTAIEYSNSLEVVPIVMSIIFVTAVGVSLYALGIAALGKYTQLARLSQAAQAHIERY
jgi:hypothetical protein